MIKRVEKPTVDRDRVVIFQDNGEADIAIVYNSDDQAIYAASPAERYAIPRADIRGVYVSPAGRIFVVGADTDYVRDTQRLAELERSIVLRQITMYDEPAEDKKLDIGRIMTWVLIGVLVLGVIFK